MIIIAEIGSSPSPAWDFGLWCDIAATCGATHIKAQMFRAEHFPPAEWESKRLLEFPRHKIERFAAEARGHRLLCGVSVFDAEAVTLAAMHCDFLKLAAREQFNQDLIDVALRTHKPLFRSISDDRANMVISSTTLATVQLYPLPMLPALVAVTRWALWFRANGAWRWGWSSHTRGILDCWLARRLGAVVIEKHLALNHLNVEAGHSLLPHEFRRMAEGLR